VKTAWGTARVDWREPPVLWITLGWLAAVLWPPLPVTMLLWPANTASGGQYRDWRVIAAVLGAISIAATMRLIERERRREGQPRTRFGVAVRFVTYGFLFSVGGGLILAVLGAFSTAIFATGDIVRRLAEFKASLLLGLVSLPLALTIGVSYAVWAGLVASIISFAPRLQNARPTNHYLVDRLLPQEPEEPYSARQPEPEAPPPPPPKPAGPHPETDLEAALRPDWDDHH
jgi:hypothetical protein